MQNRIPKPLSEQVIQLGLKFDEIEDDDLQYMGLIMLMTGYMLENIKEEKYKVFLDAFAKDAAENIEGFKKFLDDSLMDVEPKGNA